MTARATPATEVVRRAGIDHRLHEYTLPERHGSARDERPDYGAEAATALRVEPGRMFKTLIVTVDGRLAAALVPVDRQLDPRRLATALGGRTAALADPGMAQRATGGVVGGIGPLGMRRALPTVIDASAESHSTIFVSAGRRGLQLELAPADLIRLAGARLASITRSG